MGEKGGSARKIRGVSSTTTTATATTATTTLAVPAGVTLARRYYGFFGFFSSAALLGLWAAPVTAPLATTLLAFAGVFLWYARVAGRDAWGQAYAAAAQQAITRGRFDEAEALHARIPARSMRRGTVARTVAVQRALLTLFRGSPERAIAAVAPALASGTRLFSAQVERSQMASAHAVRALARAMTGDTARATADADAAEAYAEAMPEALARARLARTMVVSRRGDMVALGTELAKDGSLMLEHTMPRERALVRALRKMAHGRGRSVYREPSKPSDGGNAPGALASWIAAVAPEAAAYATDDAARAEALEAASAPIASPDAQRAIAASRRAAAAAGQAASGRQRWVMGAIGAGLVATFVVLWQLFEPVASSSAHGPEAIAEPGWLGFDAGPMAVAVAALLALACLVTLQLVRLRRINLALFGAHRAAALGDRATAEALLAGAKKSSLSVYAAAASANVAHLAERRADFALCLAECDGAIARLGAARTAQLSSEQLMPPLLGLRGLALAATGRHAEAEAELASLIARHAGYMHLPLFDFRIRFVNAVRAGDLDAARALAMQRTAELPVPLRDDLLADLVLATGPRGLPTEEIERVAAELRDNAEVCAWIDAIAPGLRGRLGAGGGVRVSESEGERERGSEGEDEGGEDVAALVRRATLGS
jgi:hypothetical protein